MPEFIKTFVGHSRKITSILQIPDNENIFLSSSTDKTVQKWNFDNENSDQVYTSKSEINDLFMGKESVYLIEDRLIKKINLNTRKNKTIFKSSSTITCIDCLLDDKGNEMLFVVGTSVGEVHLLSTEKYSIIRSLTTDGSPVTAISFLKSKKIPKLAIGTIQGNVSIYEGNELYFLVKMINTHLGEISALTWDDRFDCKLFIGNNKGIIQSRNLSGEKNGMRSDEIDFEKKFHRNAITQIVFDSKNNNNTLWTSSMDATIKASYISSKIEEIFELRPTNYPITCFCLFTTTKKSNETPFFQRKLLIGSNDHSIKLYEIAILNYFSLIWGLRNAIIEKWLDWKESIKKTDFPHSYERFLNQYSIHISKMLENNRDNIYTNIKGLFDHQWKVTTKEFDELLTTQQIKIINEEETVISLINDFKNKISSMDENFSTFLCEKILSDYSKSLTSFSNEFLENFLISLDDKINELIKEVTTAPKIQKSLNLPLFPDWFFEEITFLLKNNKLSWKNNLRTELEPELTKLTNLWFKKNSESVKTIIREIEPNLRKDLTIALKAELEKELRKKLENIKRTQMNSTDKIEPVIKNIIKNKNKFIYLNNLSPQLQLLPSVIYNELTRLISKNIVEGLIEIDDQGYFFINLKPKDIIEKKKKIDSLYEKALKKKKKKDIEKYLDEANKFMVFLHSYNFYKFDTQYEEKKEKILIELNSR